MIQGIKELDTLFDLIADDKTAITYQSMGQYRTMLLKEVNKLKRNLANGAEQSYSNCNIPFVSVSDSDIKAMFPYEDIEEARPTRPLERIMKYNARQEDRREGARILLAHIHSR